MDKKKQYLLDVINLFPDWETGWGIKALVENNQLDEVTINKLVIIFKQGMDKLSKVIKDNHMLETIHMMEDFDKQKQIQAEKDAESLTKLDSLLNDI